jgi:ferric-dicitrate binding protein FerR (iron transport regulator)
MRDLTPAQRERVLQNSRAFQNLSPDKQSKIRQQFNQWDHMSPQQQASLRQKEQTWRNLTPEQQQHLKTDVWPKWQQMPWDRQQVMKQKLGVLQNMPESARNQRLNDPNFTRGMTDDEKSMLHDLSHTHVGGPPEAPLE